MCKPIYSFFICAYTIDTKKERRWNTMATKKVAKRKPAKKTTKKVAARKPAKKVAKKKTTKKAAKRK